MRSLFTSCWSVTRLTCRVWRATVAGWVWGLSGRKASEGWEGDAGQGWRGCVRWVVVCCGGSEEVALVEEGSGVCV